MTERIVCFAAGALLGSIPSGYLIARARGVDITKAGSGNIGSTNIQRTLGTKAGLLTLLCDAGKCLVPLFITFFLYREKTELRYVLALYTGLGAMAGHSFSPFLHFRGGKGVACACGLVLFAGPLMCLTVLPVFFLTVLLTRYVSLGSVLSACVFACVNGVFLSGGRSMGWGGLLTCSAEYVPEAKLLACLAAALLIFRHKSNLQSLFKGTERKIRLREENRETGNRE